MRPGIIEAPKRKVHVRSLLPGGNIGPGNSFTYMRENGDGEGAIAPTAETGTKPQIDVDLIEATVQVETIAGWLRVTRKAMNNIPGFISFLQSRLPEKLLRIEDYQIIYGDGNTPNLKGFLHADNSVDSTSTASVLVEAIIDDISLLEDTYERSATGIVMRPADYYSFFKNKAEGSGEYDLPQGVVFINGVLYILGIPVAPTTALTEGDYVVGDFQQGAQLLIQEGMRIEFFEQDSDNVTKNKVTVRIEESVALPVYGGDYFIKGAVPAQAT
jgi:HK97 family phage major capsid protein